MSILTEDEIEQIALDIPCHDVSYKILYNPPIVAHDAIRPY